MPIIDHMGIDVTDTARSKAFYTQAVAPLGMEHGTACGFGRGAFVLDPRRPRRRSGRPHVAQPYACSSGSPP